MNSTDRFDWQLNNQSSFSPLDKRFFLAFLIALWIIESSTQAD